MTELTPEGRTSDHPRILQQFPTENPWLHRVFKHRLFGQATPRALAALEQVSPDAEELLVTAVRCRHGFWARGHLLLTTEALRWVRTILFFQDDHHPFVDKLRYRRIDTFQGLLETADGHSFQFSSAGEAKQLRELYILVSEANAWEAERG